MLYLSFTERRFGTEEKAVLQSHTLEFNPISATVSQCDLGHVFKYFDFLEAVCMMVRTWMMEPQCLASNPNSIAY